jgi:hypothetical protein
VEFDRQPTSADYEHALATDMTTYSHPLTRREVQMQTTEAIPTKEGFERLVQEGKAEGNYEAYVLKLQDELAAKSESEAKKKASGTARFLVIARPGGGWKQGQSFYIVQSKAPPELRPGRPGYDLNYKPEPGLRVRIGRVNEIPIRDERHMESLLADPNLERVDDSIHTWQEEDAIRNRALADAKKKREDDLAAAAAKAKVKASGGGDDRGKDRGRSRE